MLYEEVNTVSKSDIARLINIFFKDELLQLSHEKCNAKSTVQQFEARRNVDMWSSGQRVKTHTRPPLHVGQAV